MKRMEAALLAGLILSLVITIGADFAADCSAVRGQVLRLHVLAASDSALDQSNKLAVRDALLLESGELFTTANGVEEAIALTQDNLERMRVVAEDTLRSRGCNAEVKVTLCDEAFSTRVYEKGT
ncbi:MAG: stage II sporulation protein R, partial [Oscillospiraceae bacterium]|nr:stage II sporulation protein R [Oscillospiraceae bacterium]